MTNRQAAVIGSRVLCVWFVYQAATSLFFIPAFFIAVIGNPYSAGVLGPGYSHWMHRTLLLPTLGGLFRLAIDVAFAVFFYRAAPRLLRFLTAGKMEPD